MVPESTVEELEETVKSSASAFTEWKKSSIMARQRKMFELRDVLASHKVVTSYFLTCYLTWTLG
jgi:acyl-CoA reductase-like NAD-dependent aldehyde dehydrogenase